ncbi:hypothetical protein KC315_g11850, partial [Hortaea werneckii]
AHPQQQSYGQSHAYGQVPTPHSGAPSSTYGASAHHAPPHGGYGGHEQQGYGSHAYPPQQSYGGSGYGHHPPTASHGSYGAPQQQYQTYSGSQPHGGYSGGYGGAQYGAPPPNPGWQ